MTERTVIAYARIEAAKARIEAMKVDNTLREQKGESLAWSSEHFFDEAKEIESAITQFYQNG